MSIIDDIEVVCDCAGDCVNLQPLICLVGDWVSGSSLVGIWMKSYQCTIGFYKTALNVWINTFGVKDTE